MTRRLLTALFRGDAGVNDWASLNANAKYCTATRVAAMKNWENEIDLASERFFHFVIGIPAVLPGFGSVAFILMMPITRLSRRIERAQP